MEIHLLQTLSKLFKKKRIKPARKIRQEDDLGNIEYKLKINHTEHDRINRLITQIRFRLNEGEGSAVYNLGYTNKGFPQGLPHEELYRNLYQFHQMVEEAKGNIISIKIFRGLQGFCANIYLTSSDDHNYQKILDDFYNLSL